MSKQHSETQHIHNWHFYKLETALNPSESKFFFVCDICGKWKSVFYSGEMDGMP